MRADLPSTATWFFLFGYRSKVLSSQDLRLVFHSFILSHTSPSLYLSVCLGLSLYLCLLVATKTKMLDNLNATVVIGVSTITATVGVGLFYMASKWAEGLYDNLWKNPTTECDIDSFVSMSENPPNKLKVCLAHTLRMGSRTANTTTPIPLECTKSPHVKGLYVSRKVQLSSEQSSKNESEEMPTPLNDLLPRMTSDGKLDPTDNGVQNPHG